MAPSHLSRHTLHGPDDRRHIEDAASGLQMLPDVVLGAAFGWPVFLPCWPTRDLRQVGEMF